jgi:hypothetical protein
LAALNTRVQNLDSKIALRNDSKLAQNLATLADRMARAQDRATYREYRDFERERAQEAAEARAQARRDAEHCRRHHRMKFARSRRGSSITFASMSATCYNVALMPIDDEVASEAIF